MSATDPSDFVRNPPSVIVKVQNTSQESVNGKLGIVVQYTQERGRYLVHLTETQQSVALKPENLVKASMFEQAKAQYQQLTKDPQIKREITKYYNLAASKLPPNVKPEHAAAGFGVALLLAMYFVGFTRVLMVITMILLVGLIIAPDLLVNGNLSIPHWKVLVNNFPMRCRTTIEQSMPLLKGRLTDKIAAGIVLLFLTTSLFTVIMPKSPATAAAATRPAAAGRPLASAASIEEAYRFGFEDATAGKEFGTSMPAKLPAGTKPIVGSDPLDTSTGGAGSSNYYYEEDDFMPLPRTVQKSWYQKLGMWQIMSIMNIGRTLNELGRDAHGAFSPQLVWARLQTADPMKLGLFSLSVYNVVKVFF